MLDKLNNECNTGLVNIARASILYVSSQKVSTKQRFFNQMHRKEGFKLDLELIKVYGSGI